MTNVLKNAPLTEVVFELRWEGAKSSIPIRSDPGYSHVLDRLTGFARDAGFGRVVDIHPPYAGAVGSVSRRYYPSDAQFPLLQLGHGIFASNASSEYEWSDFRRRSLDAATAVVNAYPKFIEHHLAINHVELRYLDTFDESVANVVDFVGFLHSATNMRLDPTSFWQSKGFSRQGNGRLVLDFEVASPVGAKFALDIASASYDDTPAIRMETKVVSSFSNALPSNSKRFSDALSRWLDEAHNLTSPAFRSLITEEVLEKFQ